MDETTIGWILGVFGVVIAFLLNSLRVAIDSLRNADKSLVDRVHAVEKLVLADYAKTSDIIAIRLKLDTICGNISSINGYLKLHKREGDEC